MTKWAPESQTTETLRIEESIVTYQHSGDVLATRVADVLKNLQKQEKRQRKRGRWRLYTKAQNARLQDDRPMRISDTGPGDTERGQIYRGKSVYGVGEECRRDRLERRTGGGTPACHPVDKPITSPIIPNKKPGAPRSIQAKKVQGGNKSHLNQTRNNLGAGTHETAT